MIYIVVVDVDVVVVVVVVVGGACKALTKSRHMEDHH
jgi:hypothetical protein